MAPKTEKKAPSHPPYQVLIKEAISALKERSGSSLAAITKYVGEKHNLPGPWKKTLSLQLKRLTEAGKLVKVLTTLHAPVPAGSIPRLPRMREALQAQYAAPAGLGAWTGRRAGPRIVTSRFRMLAARGLNFRPRTPTGEGELEAGRGAQEEGAGQEAQGAQGGGPPVCK